MKLKKPGFKDIVIKLTQIYDLVDSIQLSLDEYGEGFASVKTKKLKKDISFILQFLTKDMQDKEKDNLKELLKVNPYLQKKINQIISPLLIRSESCEQREAKE